MQNRHLDRYTYFCESAQTSQDFYISYLGRFIDITSSSKVLEIGCGEGGNLLPFAQKGCAVVGIDVCISRINEAIDFFSRKDKAGKFICDYFFCLDISQNAADSISAAFCAKALTAPVMRANITKIFFILCEF